jgi:hypothetical protein
LAAAVRHEQSWNAFTHATTQNDPGGADKALIREFTDFQNERSLQIDRTQNEMAGAMVNAVRIDARKIAAL